MAATTPSRETLWPNGRDELGALSAGVMSFADAPTTPFEGQLVNFSDADTAVWGANITSTGANHVLARWNGSNWTVVGK